MERVCPYMVGFSSECKKIIKMYLPQIWQFLEEEMVRDILWCQGKKKCQEEKKFFVPFTPGSFCDLQGDQALSEYEACPAGCQA